jgi:DNA-directed RNA polymerase beta subunit
MKVIKSALSICFSFILLAATAQTKTPKGYQKGSVTLADGNIRSGFIKETMRKNASLVYTNEAGTAKKTYTASDLVAAEIDGTKYTSISNDFFKIICEGEICYLQKISDARGSIIYNGTDPIVVNGTDGKPGDYFVYQSADKQLKLVTEKNVTEVAASVFGAKDAKTDLLQLKDAIIAFNKNSK